MSLLNEALTKSKKSGKELAELSGISESTVSAIRNGRGKVETLEKLLKSLGYELVIKKVKL